MQLHEEVLQVLLIGVANGAIVALIALGYTLVYGIIGLINFAHGDLFMLGAMLALTLLGAFGLRGAEFPPLGAVVCLVVWFAPVPLFCAGLNWAVDRVVYKPLRHAPKLA